MKWLLAVEEGLTLLDVHVLTFHQLAVKVISDVRPEAMPHAVNPAFREQLLRSLVYRAIPGADVFRDWTEMHGVWAGVWATIQDLKESGVETSVLMSAIDEGLLGGEDPVDAGSLLESIAESAPVPVAIDEHPPRDLRRGESRGRYPRCPPPRARCRASRPRSGRCPSVRSPWRPGTRGGRPPTRGRAAHAA